MAPLHEVIPSWSKEPQKYWQGMEKGEYDWAHLAMDYWPERVRAPSARLTRAWPSPTGTRSGMKESDRGVEESGVIGG